MISLLLLSLQVRFSITANRLIHFLRRIPGLKNAISPQIYGNYGMKMFFVVLGAIFIANKKIFFHLLYIAFLVALGIGLNQVEVHGGFYEFISTDGTAFEGMTMEGVVGYTLLAWFILSFVGGLTSSVTVGVNHKNDDIMINYLLTNAAVYSHGRILLSRIVDIVLFIPFLLIAFVIADIPLWGVITTLVMYTAFQLSGEAINMIMFRHIGKHFSNTAIAIVTGIIFFPAAIIIPAYMTVPNLSLIFANPFTAVLSALVGFLACVYIKNYPLYLMLLRDKIRWYNNAMTEAQKTNSTLNFKDAKKWSKDIDLKNLQSDKHNHKTGFAYLNAIFFDRHKKYFKKKIFIRSLIFLALPAVTAIFILYLVVIGGEPPSAFLENDNGQYLFNFAPIFFFVIYIATMGRIVTASVFSNCDIHMLHYPYYRIRETILASFKARFIFILRYNFIVTTVMSFSLIVTAWLLYGYLDYRLAGIFFVLLSVIGVLFAFNDLFLYYVIQPYDSAGKGKSIVYSIINFAISMIAWMNFHVRPEFVTYAIIVTVATVLYLVVGTVLLLALAPKNFKLR